MKNDPQDTAVVSPDETAPAAELISPVEPAPSMRRTPKNALDVPISEMSPEELRRYNLAKTQKSRAKKAEKKKQADYVYDSKSLPSESEAIEILEDRGIRSGHIAQTVYNLAVIAAETLGITPNRFYFANGVDKTLGSYAAKSAQPLSEIEDVWYPGERIRLRDLHALWDFGMSWREQEDGRLI